MKLPSALVGAAGTYYVASRLSLAGLNAAITVGNAPGVDILASLPEGNAAVAIQVKTTTEAWRKRSLTSNIPHDYDWAVGKKLALTNEPRLIVTLVDLKNPEQDGKINELPDVYLVRSTQIYDYFQGVLKQTGKSELAMYRYWPRVEEIEPYKNRWNIVAELLHGS
jgi:hypothetical protein